MEDDEMYIAITHFINPHQFWYTCTEDKNFFEVCDLEEKLTKRYIHSISGTTKHFTPVVGSNVAVEYIANKKRFIRARIEEKICKPYTKSSSYIVWAIDHGFPFETNEEHIRYLPDEFAKNIDRVRCGGIAEIVPAEEDYDFIQQRKTLEVKNTWNSAACKELERILVDAASIAFSEQFKSKDGHFWGDLNVVNHHGELLQVSDYLVDEKIALKNFEKFKEFCIKSSRTQMPVFQSNDGRNKCSKNKCNTLDHFPDSNANAVSLPSQSEIQSAKLKVAAWSAHNENATNYMGLGTKRSEGSFVGSLLYDTDMDDSVSKYDCVNEEVKSLSLKNRGIHKKINNQLPPKPKLVDFGIFEDTLLNASNINQGEKPPDDLSDISSLKTCSVSEANSRYRFLLEMRKKQLSQKKLESSRKILTSDIKAFPIYTPSKRDEDNAPLVSSSIEITDYCTKNMNRLELSHKAAEDASSNSSVKSSNNVSPLGLAHHLNSLRIKSTKAKSSEKQTARESKSNSINSKSVVQKTSARHKEHIIPAGFDLTNLNTYRDRNHWHRKSTMIYEQQSQNISNSSDFKNQNQDFRFTRPNTDKNEIKHVDQNQNGTKILNVMMFSGKKESSASNEEQMNDDLAVEKNHFQTVINKDSSNIENTHTQTKESSFSDSSQKSDETKYSSAASCLDEDSQDENNVVEMVHSKLKHSKAYLTTLTKKPQNTMTYNNKHVMSNSNNNMNKFQEEQINGSRNDRVIRTKFSEHLVLAHSQIPLYTAEKLEDVFLEPSVFKEMSMFIDKVYRIQTYAWSHMISGNGLFIVNSANTGKTWSYIPPLCSSIVFNLQNSIVPSTYGPMAIILVSSADHAIKVGNICIRLLNKFDNKEVKTVISYGLQKFVEIKIQLMEGCAILVTTSSNLLRLMNDHENKDPLFDPKRIQHIIIDDIDVQLSRAPNDLKVVLKKIYGFVPKVSKSKKILPQLVVTACFYQPILKKLIPISNQPLLLMGDFLEAAVYGKANIMIKLCRKEEKMALVFQFIKNHSNFHEKLIILCNCEGDVLFIVENLMSSGIPCVGFHKKSSASALQEIEDWKQQLNPMKILVCSDDVFPELEVKNAQNLIHYSLAKTWTKFTFRFISLIDIYENLIVKGFDGPPPEKRATSLVLLDEDNNVELPRLIEFLKYHNQIEHVPSNILELSKRIQIQKEIKRSSENTQLCNALFQFGECNNVRCEFRHVLVNADINQESNGECFQHGDLRLLILNVFSPTYFSARLLEHRETGLLKWNIVRKSNKAAEFAIKFNSFYSLDPNNLKMHWPVQLNDLVVVKKNYTFHRSRVIDVSEIKSTNIIQSVLIKLKLIDTGNIVHVNSDELYVCHEQFRDFPAQAVDIRLNGVLPFDNERGWDSIATNHVESLIKENLGDNDCVYASIDFALKDAIWVNNVVLMERLPTIKSNTYKVNLKRHLVNNKYGVLNDGIVTKIHNIIKEQGFKHILEKKKSSITMENPVKSDNAEDYPKRNNQGPLDIGKTHTNSLTVPENSLHNLPQLDENCASLSTCNYNANFSQISQNEPRESQIDLLKSDETVANNPIAKESESPLPAVCNFQEFLICLQRSIELDEEEYNITGKEMPEGFKKYFHEKKSMCNDAITYEEKKKGKTQIKDIKEKNINIPEKRKSNLGKSEIISQMQAFHKNKQNTICSFPPQLINLHPRPPTVWYETNHLIILSIYAPSIDYYFLEVTNSSLYFTAYVNGIQKVLVLNFLGTVEPQLVSHEVRGLNVIVRLVKTLYVKWPRLLKQKGKIPWLTYNLNMINKREMEELMPQQFLGNILNANTSNPSSDNDLFDSDDDEYDTYQTFTPIINKEDVHDPMSGELI